MPEPVGCCSTSCGYAQRLGARAKNLNTVHFLMKRFNKI